MKRLFTILYFLFFIAANATTKKYLDSVENALKITSNIDAKLLCLYTLSFEYGLIEPYKGIQYGFQCLELAQKNNNLKYQLNAYNGIANCYETISNYDSAYYYHILSNAVAEKLNVSYKKALTLFNAALCKKQLGNYIEALNIFLSAYEILENEQTYNPRIHYYLSEMYLILEDYNNAEKQAVLGIQKCVEFNHPYIGYNMYINLAKCLMHKQEIDSAIAMLQSILKLLQEHTDQNSIAICLNALGEAFLIKNDFANALQQFSDELLIQKEIKNYSGIYLSQLNIAYCASNISPLNKSLIKKQLSESAVTYNNIIRNLSVLIQGYYKTASVYEKIGDNTKALIYFKKYHSLNDSLLNFKKQWQLNEIQTIYETHKKEHKIATLQQSDKIKSLGLIAKDSSIKKRNYIIVATVLVFILMIIVAFLFYQKQKSDRLLEKEKTIKKTEGAERMRIAKDIHDDLGSGLSKINFLSELIIRSNTLSKENKNYTVSISETAKKLVINMRDLIWALNPENTTLAGLVARIREHSYDYMEDCSIETVFNFPETVEAFTITKESHRNILMTVKECLNNIVKHSKATLVTINLNIENEQLIVIVKDNGTGFNPEVIKGNGIGNMQSRMKQIGGKLKIVSNNNGSEITLKIEYGKLKSGELLLL